MAHDSGACCASPLRHLRAGAAARGGNACFPLPCGTLTSAQGFLSSNHLGPMRWHGVGSRFPLKMEPGAGRMSVAFSPAWRRPLLGLLQTGLDPRHKARGPCASTKVEPAIDRPSPRSVLVQTSTHPSAATGRQASLSTSRSGLWAGLRGSWRRQGHSHSKPNNLFSSKLSMKQFLSEGGPYKLP